jgi:hypothetical protein
MINIRYVALEDRNKCCLYTATTIILILNQQWLSSAYKFHNLFFYLTNQYHIFRSYGRAKEDCFQALVCWNKIFSYILPCKYPLSYSRYSLPNSRSNTRDHRVEVLLYRSIVLQVNWSSHYPHLPLFGLGNREYCITYLIKIFYYCRLRNNSSIKQQAKHDHLEKIIDALPKKKKLIDNQSTSSWDQKYNVTMERAQISTSREIT